MRIAKNKVQPITEAPSARFLLMIDAMDGDVLLNKDGKTLLSIALDENGDVIVQAHTPKESLLLKGKDAYHKEVILTASYARLGLYVGGLLADEEFFLAPIDYQNSEIIAGSYMHFEAGYEYHSMAESAVVENATLNWNGFRPPFGRDMALLRPTPVCMRDRLSVFYLDERRGGKAKGGMGAQRVCQIFEADRRIHTAPIALPIDSVEEKRMSSFSPITVGERTYLYYIVEYRAYRSLSCAVSDDGLSFIKTGLDIEVEGMRTAEIDAISLWEEKGDVYMLFTVNGVAYQAKSIDLLHFSSPERLAFLDGVENLYTTVCGDKQLFMGEKNGVTVYTLSEHIPWKEFPLCLKNARAVFFQNAFCVFGTENGALKCEVLCSLE